MDNLEIHIYYFLKGSDLLLVHCNKDHFVFFDKGKRTEKKRIDRSYEREATTGSIDMNVGKKTEDSLRSRSAPPEEMNTGE